MLLCQISCSSVKQLMSYDDFSIFEDGGWPQKKKIAIYLLIQLEPIGMRFGKVTQIDHANPNRI